MHHGRLSQPTAKGLEVLRQRIARAGVPSSCLDETLTIATWNIREFGRRRRKRASLHYIAEILGQFDLCCIVELREDTRDLETVLGYLGPYWRVVYSDFTPDRGGNHERLAFVFDRRAAVFTGLASNVHAGRRRVGGEYVAEPDWWRPPYLASFRAGSFDFVLVAAHIRWGGDGAAGEKARLPEIQMLADWVDRRVHHALHADHDLVVVGDFNIPSVASPLYRALAARGLRMPAGLMGEHGSNLDENKRYDQILHLPRFTHSFTGLGGVVDFYAGDHQALFPRCRMTKREFTFEMSDHLPLWAQVRTDVESERVDGVVGVAAE